MPGQDELKKPGQQPQPASATMDPPENAEQQQAAPPNATQPATVPAQQPATVPAQTPGEALNLSDQDASQTYVPERQSQSYQGRLTSKQAAPVMRPGKVVSQPTNQDADNADSDEEQIPNTGIPKNKVPEVKPSGQDEEDTDEDEEGSGTQIGYAELLKELEADHKPKTEADVKRERREKLFSAIGDAIGAFSNLWFTTKGAPNSYDYTKNMSDKTKARWDQLNKDFDANHKNYLNGYMKLLEKQNADAITQRNWERQKQQDEFNRSMTEAKNAREEIKLKYDQKYKDLQMEVMAGKLEWQKYLNEKAKIDAEYEEALKKAEIQRKLNSGSGGDGKKSKATSIWKAKDKDGKVHEFEATNTDNAYSIAGANGWVITGKKTTKVTTQEGTGRNKSKKTVTTTEVDNDDNNSDSADNTPPSRRPNDADNKPPSRRK
jgi:hypothetical protein